MKKLLLLELFRQFSCFLKKNWRIWLKILHSITIKLATGEVTTNMCHFDENLEKLKF